MWDRQRFTFRFFNRASFREEEVVIVGTHYDDAKSGAWAVLGERMHERRPRDTWRLVSTMQAPIMARVIPMIAGRVGLILAVFGLLLVAAPAVAEPKYNGQWTVGEFRSWPEGVQAGYVLGWREQSALLAAVAKTQCERNVTNGEYVAALKFDTGLAATDRLSLAMFALETRNGCMTSGGAR